MDPFCKQHGCYMFKDGPERVACEKNCRLEAKVRFVSECLREALDGKVIRAPSVEEIKARLADLYNTSVENIRYDPDAQRYTVVLPPPLQYIDITVELEEK